jgi:hypothetical protein
VAVDRSGEFSYLTTSISNQPPPPNEAIAIPVGISPTITLPAPVFHSCTFRESANKGVT